MLNFIVDRLTRKEAPSAPFTWTESQEKNLFHNLVSIWTQKFGSIEKSGDEYGATPEEIAFLEYAARIMTFACPRYIDKYKIRVTDKKRAFFRPPTVLYEEVTDQCLRNKNKDDQDTAWLAANFVGDFEDFKIKIQQLKKVLGIVESWADLPLQSTR